MDIPPAGEILQIESGSFVMPQNFGSFPKELPAVPVAITPGAVAPLGLGDGAVGTRAAGAGEAAPLQLLSGTTSPVLNFCAQEERGDDKKA